MILKAVASRLLESAIVRDVIDTKVYFDRAPQGAGRPYALLTTDSVNPQDLLDGQPIDDETRVQIDFWVDDSEKAYDQLQALEEQARRQLEGLTGLIDTTLFKSGTLTRSNTLATPPESGRTAWRRRLSMEFTFIHSNNVPRLGVI